jgi:hypothetical protein
MADTYEKRLALAVRTSAFVQEWISLNLNGMSDCPDIARETDRLASMMTGDARSHEISGADISRAIGNIDDYLTSELEKRQRNPGLNAF